MGKVPKVAYLPYAASKKKFGPIGPTVRVWRARKRRKNTSKVTAEIFRQIVTYVKFQPFFKTFDGATLIPPRP